MPEKNDTELTDGEIVRRNNDELVSTWGNLVNRVLTMTYRYFEGVVPPPGELDGPDRAVLAEVDAALGEAAELMRGVKLHAGLQRMMAGASAVNAYLNERQPWSTAKSDPGRTATTLTTALEAIAGLAVGFGPYLPATSARVLADLGAVADGWRRPVVTVGHRLPDAVPLFSRLESLDEDD